MAQTSPEAEFHSTLYTRLNDFIHSSDTPFDSVSIEENTERGRADIIVRSDLTDSFVIEVKRDDVYPLDRDVIRQARDYADDVDVDFFATCNSNDFFLFHYTDQVNVQDIPYYYLSFRDVDLFDRTLDGNILSILQAVQHLTRSDELPQQRERDQIVGLLRSFHSSIWPTFRALLEEEYETNPRLTDEFDEWVRENDYASLSDEEQFELAAKQYTYLLPNKILFYELIRDKTPEPIETRSGSALNSLVDGVSQSGIDTHLHQRFEEIQSEIDYEPIFDDSGDSLFANFPHNPKTRKAIVDLLNSTDAHRLSNINEDLLGELYEELIPASERKALGQFYTDPDIAEAICNWSLRSTESGDVPRVLDPASGSGTFPVAAYNRIQQICPTANHQEIIDNITSVDINRFPLHLTALNLASCNVEKNTDHLNTYNRSFFTVYPESEDLPGDGDAGARLGSFDAIVANPPYIRQEDLYPDKEHFRTHLSDFGRENTSPYYDGSRKLSNKSDAYIYFITHAFQFLKEGGRLGFIVPTKWLDTKYGEDFQEFLYDHAKVHTVVGFSSRAFTALVDTVLLFVEKCGNEDSREETVTDFVRLKEEVGPDTLADIAEYENTVPEGDPFAVQTREEYRTVSVPQKRLADQGGQKLGYFLYSPAPFIPLIRSEKMVSLDTYADVSFGNKTGANSFFLLNQDDVEQWDLPDRFLKPAIRSIRDMDDMVLDETDQYFLDFDGYIDEYQSQQADLSSTSDLAGGVKEALRDDGYDSVIRYLEYGEDQGVPNGSTVSNHTPWFNLGDLLVPDILHPVFYNERIFTVQNNGEFAPTNAIQCVDLLEHEDVLPYILNSTLHKIMLELWGRHEGGGALQLLTYEVSSVPVLNPEVLTDEQRSRIQDAGSRLVEGDSSAQTDLDAAVLSALELGIGPEELQSMHESMVLQRVEGAESEDVLIQNIDEFDEYDLDSLIPDYDPASGSGDNQTLDNF